MQSNTSPKKYSVIVTIYKYLEAESKRHQFIAGIKCVKEHCLITEIYVFSMYPYVNRLYFSILHCWVHNIFEHYRIATVAND